MCDALPAVANGTVAGLTEKDDRHMQNLGYYILTIVVHLSTS